MGKFFLDSRQVRSGVESEVSFFCALHKWMGREATCNGRTRRRNFASFLEYCQAYLRFCDKEAKNESDTGNTSGIFIGIIFHSRQSQTTTME